MSGDVQPRKRGKDKSKRRREDEEVPVKGPQVSGVPTAKMGPDDIQLHVHSDHGTGGHWCAKIFFFSLMAILVGLVGLILLENRGLSDLDTPLSESRFANYLDGWVEEKRESHDEHDILESLHELDDHEHDDEPFSEEEDHDDENGDHDDDGQHDDDHDDDDHDDDDEHDDDEDGDDHDDGSDEAVADADDDEEASDEQNEDEKPEVANSADNDDVDDDDDNDAGGDDENVAVSEEEASDEQAPEDDDDDDNGNDENDEDDDRATAESKEDDNDDDDDASNDVEATNSQAVDNDDDDGDDNDIDPFEEEDDDDDVSLEEVIDNDEGEDLHLQKLANKDEPAGDEDDSEPADESSSQETRDALNEELRQANELLADNPESALKRFDDLLSRYPNRTSVLHGRSVALDRLAAKQHNNQLLGEAIDGYEQLVIAYASQLKDDEFRSVAERCVELMRFIGQNLRAVPVHEMAIARFANEPELRNQLAVTYLMANRLDDAKFVLHQTLLRWPHDGFAQVHYGFVLKNLDNDLTGAVRFLRDGILTGDKGTSDGRFFFALGDSLQRLGRVAEARRIYRVAVARKLFLSEYQRSLYNVDRLQSRPFWSVDDTSVLVQQQLQVLEQNWERIRDEGLSVLGADGYFTDESENLRERGLWKQFDLFARGRKVVKHCDLTPFTCQLIDGFSAARTCTRGQVKFSVMHPGTHVWPHCGPTNCRIRAHLGLQVPPKTFIRVANETRSWREGSLLIFDDSFEHEVWHNGTDVRLVLIVDFWHPDLTAHERKTLPPI